MHLPLEICAAFLPSSGASPGPHCAAAVKEPLVPGPPLPWETVVYLG